MSETQIQLSIDGPHAAITFVTDSGVNIASSSVLRNLRDTLAKVRGDANVRTTSFQAKGKVFLAGADIKEMCSFSPDAARAFAQLGHDTLNEIETLPSITVAAIHGAAMGGGLELALACDFRIAVKSARLGLPETSLGLVPGWAGMARLTALVGNARAKKIFFSAMPLSAEQGLAIGLVDEIVNSPEDLDARVPVFCKSFRRGSPTAISLAKQAVHDGDDITAFAEAFNRADSREGIAAFLEKRPASWME